MRTKTKREKERESNQRSASRRGAPHMMLRTNLFASSSRRGSAPSKVLPERGVPRDITSATSRVVTDPDHIFSAITQTERQVGVVKFH